jgi:hypothetical protein
MIPAWLLTGCFPCSVRPDLFFPPGYGPEYEPQIRFAKALCADCPCRHQCRDFAIARPELQGIWSGLTPLERRRARVQRNQRR